MHRSFQLDAVFLQLSDRLNVPCTHKLTFHYNSRVVRTQRQAKQHANTLCTVPWVSQSVSWCFTPSTVPWVSKSVSWCFTPSTVPWVSQSVSWCFTPSTVPWVSKSVGVVRPVQYPGYQRGAQSGPVNTCSFHLLPQKKISDEKQTAGVSSFPSCKSKQNNDNIVIISRIALRILVCSIQSTNNDKYILFQYSVLNLNYNNSGFVC